MQNESRHVKMINNPPASRMSPETSKTCLIENCESECKIDSIGFGNGPGNKSVMRARSDEETEFDIFEYDMNPNPEEDKIFTDKDGSVSNGENENNFGSDMVKNKDVCWAAGNIDDSELCPLKSYQRNNDSSFFHFSRDNFDYETREGLSQGWPFIENFEKINQVQEQDREQEQEQDMLLSKKPMDAKATKRKKWTMEKCFTNNQSVLKGNRYGSNKMLKSTNEDSFIDKTERDKDYAFVCDKLDDFLDQEAELKINYEIPHLYAEHGIKLTSDEIVSRPNVKLKDVEKEKEREERVKEREEREKEREEREKEREKEREQEKEFPEIGLKSWKVSTPTHKKFKNNKKTDGKFKKSTPAVKSDLPVRKGENNVDEDRKTERQKENKKTSLPCRRSSRIMQISVLTKPNNTCDRSLQCDLETDEIIEPKKPKNSNKLILGLSNYKLVVKKFGMLLHVKPRVALNPIIRFHLDKIRSFETSIDKKWANFAASAVHVRGTPSKCHKMILPLKCCFKYKTRSLQEEKESKIEPEVRETVSRLVDRVCDNIDKEINVITKRKANLSSKGTSSVCRREITESRNRFRNRNHDFVFSKNKKNKTGSEMETGAGAEAEARTEMDMDMEMEMEMETERDRDLDFYESKDSPFTSPCKYPPELYQMPFNNIITKLLSKKLNELKSTQKLTHSIDKLKMFKQNVLELIKLNFIKESFMCSYINLWFAKIEEKNKYRVFLTFSLNPPVDEAVNLRMTSRYSPSDLPKIIRELITKEDLFDPNDFAILYCNGKYWEIYGSVNFTMNKSGKNLTYPQEKVQVFRLTGRLSSELEMLDLLKHVKDGNKNSKWWVMHMMQDYQEVLIKMNGDVENGCGTGRVSRNEIMDTSRSKLPSFISFQGAKLNRPFGVLFNPRLYPYFLIGPYNPEDNHGLSLRLQTRYVPFEYCPPMDRVESNFFLKRFISSIIRHCWRNKMRVVGMWLYNSPGPGKTNFLEVRTRSRKTSMFTPNEDHNYNLSDLHLDEGIFKIVSESAVKKQEKLEATANERIYLVPDIPNLGYIIGLLHPDKSITVENPRKSGRMVRSYNIGDWLNMIMKKKITFIPKELEIKWEIVKNAHLLYDRKPFDRYALCGTHIICEKGIFYLLALTQEKIRDLGLDESVVKNIVKNNPIVQEVLILRQIEKDILMKDRCGLTMAGALDLTLKEIEKLEKEDRELRQTKIKTEKERDFLCRKFIKSLDSCQMDEKLKKTMQFYVCRIMENKKQEETFKCLERVNKFLLESLEGSPDKTTRPCCSSSDRDVRTRLDSDSSDEKHKTKSESNGEQVHKLESKIKNLYQMLKKCKSGDLNLKGDLEKRLNLMSENLEKIKSNAHSDDAPFLSESSKNLASLNGKIKHHNHFNFNNNNNSNSSFASFKRGTPCEKRNLPSDDTGDDGNARGESCSGIKRKKTGIFFINNNNNKKKDEVSGKSSFPPGSEATGTTETMETMETILPDPLEDSVVISPSKGKSGEGGVPDKFFKRSLKSKIPDLLSIAGQREIGRDRAQLVKKGKQVLVFTKRKIKQEKLQF